MAVLSGIGLFGTALLYGDGMITPAISVLSAVEGAELAVSGIDHFVVPIVDRHPRRPVLDPAPGHGDDRQGLRTGHGRVVRDPVRPRRPSDPAVARRAAGAVAHVRRARSWLDNGFGAFLALGSVFLVVTGGEALYADMGHFGRRPITVGWYAIVLPGLVLNYFGQAALLIREPDAIENPFFRLAPTWGVLPLVAARHVRHRHRLAGPDLRRVLADRCRPSSSASPPHAGGPHVRVRDRPGLRPGGELGLMVACVGLVVGFGSSSALAAAYGVAVTTTMVITTILLWYVLRDRFGWSTPAATALCLRLRRHRPRVLRGQRPQDPGRRLVPARSSVSAVFTAMTTWRTGRRLVGDRIRAGQVPLETFLASLAEHDDGPLRVPGTAIYLFSTPGMTPPALVSNLRHNNVLHEDAGRRRRSGSPTCPGCCRHAVPRSPSSDLGVRAGDVHYGFMEEPDVPDGPRRRGRPGTTTSTSNAPRTSSAPSRSW